MSFMVQKIAQHMDFDIQEINSSHLDTKNYWTERVRKIDVDGITLRLFINEEYFVELFKKKLMKSDKIVDEKDSEKWIKQCVVGGISKIKLDL